ncbi:MAG TPA: HEAT repeat domain-containing protein [Vicinamibacterales bacterium]|nr:HEAT repeat domain-containing protein [Vicinamibacterales bacterium]
MPLGILTVDAALVVRTWDGWLAASTGIAAADAVGRPLADVVPDLEARGFLQRFARVLATGEVQVLAPAFHHYLVPCPPRQPSRFFDRMQQRVTLGPLREGTGIVGVMATVEDVTARIDRERELTEGLRADDWTVRRTAISELSREADPDLFHALVEALRVEHRDFNVLSSALQLLAASELDLTGPLVTLMADPDPGLRMQAALALGERQTAGAVEALMAALQDPDINVRFHAIEALGRMRAGDAVDALADLAESDDFFLVFPAVDALARIHDARVVPRLIPLLRRPDITQPVADALGELGGAEAVAPLAAVVNETGHAAPVARALARIYERYEEHYAGGALIVSELQAAIAPSGAQRLLDAVDAASADDLPGLVTVLGWLRGPAVERALARLLGQPTVRSAVIEAIARREASAGIVDTLVEQLRADDADVRLAAIAALGRIGDRRAAPALAATLDRPRREIVAAASALARIGDPSSFEALLPLLSHQDAAVRQAAIGALNSLGHPAMASRVAALLSSPDPRTRESAVRIAGYFGYPDCVDTLIERCADADDAVRRAAVEHLPYLDDPRVAAQLARALDDPAARVRAAAAQALAHLASAAAREPLRRALQDGDPWVRYYAVRSLGEIRDGSALERLSALAAADPAMHVRIAALESFGAIGEPAALDVLLQYAGDAETDLAAAALRALGRFDADRARAALKNALRAPDAMRRTAAVAGLRASAAPDAVDALAWTAGADTDAAVAAAAIEALGAIAGRSGDPFARAAAALLALTADPARRDASVAALARLPESRIATIADGLSHLQPDVRLATIDVLARLRHPDASAALRTALEDADAAVREAAVTALDRLGARGTLRLFARMAREDSSRAVRRAAAAALGRATDAPLVGDGHEDR